MNKKISVPLLSYRFRFTGLGTNNPLPITNHVVSIDINYKTDTLHLKVRQPMTYETDYFEYIRNLARYKNTIQVDFLCSTNPIPESAIIFSLECIDHNFHLSYGDGGFAYHDFNFSILSYNLTDEFVEMPESKTSDTTRNTKESERTFVEPENVPLD
ncbi:MAG: hypothetical protein WC284_08740 [Candidimonas sp.]